LAALLRVETALCATFSRRSLEMSRRNASSQRRPGSAAIDEFDHRILALYQHDSRLVAEAIGEKVGLSAASVQRRLKRLREIGVIVRETAELNGSAVGIAVVCIVGVDLVDERAEHIASFKKAMLEHRSVQQCYYVTGEIDFIVVVAARDLAEYEAFARAAFSSNRNVRSFTTYVVMDAVKVGTGLPL
jgi:Lrp/AsnC family transcriptional regulator, leucine-responsive regulatory protein